jgi:hypothetical protein
LIFTIVRSPFPIGKPRPDSARRPIGTGRQSPKWLRSAREFGFGRRATDPSKAIAVRFGVIVNFAAESHWVHFVTEFGFVRRADLDGHNRGRSKEFGEFGFGRRTFESLEASVGRWGAVVVSVTNIHWVDLKIPPSGGEPGIESFDVIALMAEHFMDDGATFLKVMTVPLNIDPASRLRHPPDFPLALDGFRGGRGRRAQSGQVGPTSVGQKP